jgi:pimeloyl-ACP methyl ester carboxylesterase
MVLPAINPTALPDPIFYLSGGPGTAASEIGPSQFRSMGEVRKDRDVVFVDQRGTGSSHPLDCVMDPGIFADDVTLRHITDVQAQRMRECMEEFDADLTLYTTPIAMDDLDEVRQVLGYDRINLIGGSYGTRAALVYMRRHPERVRSVVLDGVVPFEMQLPRYMGRDAERALELMLTDCERDDACRAAFPELRAHFDALLARLVDQPEAIEYVHPRTGETMRGVVYPDVLTGTIRSVLYSRELSILLPLAIEQAYQRNYTPLVAMAGFFEEMGMSLGMTYSVICSEDIAHLTRHRIPRFSSEVSRFGPSVYDSFYEVCEFWPKGDIPDDYFDPTHSDVPVLLTSGALDPVTPPEWGEQAAKHLSRSRHLVVPGVGHGTLTYGCLPGIVAQFIERVDAEGIDESCIYELRRPPFFYSMAGPVARDSVDD